MSLYFIGQKDETPTERMTCPTNQWMPIGPLNKLLQSQGSNITFGYYPRNIIYLGFTKAGKTRSIHSTGHSLGALITEARDEDGNLRPFTLLEKVFGPSFTPEGRSLFDSNYFFGYYSGKVRPLCFESNAGHDMESTLITLEGVLRDWSPPLGFIYVYDCSAGFDVQVNEMLKPIFEMINEHHIKLRIEPPKSTLLLTHTDTIDEDLTKRLKEAIPGFNPVYVQAADNTEEKPTIATVKIGNISILVNTIRLNKGMEDFRLVYFGSDTIPEDFTNVVTPHSKTDLVIKDITGYRFD